MTNLTLQFNYLFKPEYRDPECEWGQKRLNEFENQSLELYLAEYEKLAKAEEALREANCLIDNVGYMRSEEDNHRKYVYSTELRDQFNKEYQTSRRSNARKNTSQILQDQKNLVLYTACEKYGHCRAIYSQFEAIDQKYREQFNKFWNAFSITQ
jgi:hypothetical protein